MTLRRKIFAGAIGSFLALVVPPAEAQSVLTDGGFESQASGVSQYCYLGSGCPSGAWTGAGGFVVQNQVNWGVGPAVSPSYACFLQGAAYVQQTFVASASGQHRLVFWAAGRPTYPGAYGGDTVLSVSLNGSTLSGSFALVSGQPFTKFVSAPFDLVQGATYTIGFSAQPSASNGGDNTAFLDSVKLVWATDTGSYSYDALGRLISAAHAGGVSDGQQTQYTYDHAGNRTNVNSTTSP